jgi:predicted metal-dependent hydrolase
VQPTASKPDASNSDPAPRFDSHYLGFFEAFNRQLFFEAHEILEIFWLPLRRQPEGDFYKGLIQLAGAFVHFKKARRGPAGALLRLAKRNLSAYPSQHEGLDLERVINLIAEWEVRLASSPPDVDPYFTNLPPQLQLPQCQQIQPSE